MPSRTKRGLHEIIKIIAPELYEARPDWMPFAGGVDRASMCGEESAQTFAQRKLQEQYQREYRRHGGRANTSLRGRTTTADQRSMSEPSTLCAPVLSGADSEQPQVVLEPSRLRITKDKGRQSVRMDIRNLATRLAKAVERRKNDVAY